MTQDRIAKVIKTSRQTLSGFESGIGKYLKLELATNYYNYICKLRGFPSDLTFDDFLTKDLSTRFGKLSEPPTESAEPTGETDYINQSDKTGAQPFNGLSPGLLEFLNDEWEMAAVNPTQDEIEILKKIPWNASKDFYRRAIGDIRRSRSISKRKAVGDSGQSSAG